ncbi:hypothetical protein C3747_3g207 [Trypanosoma cruzi]|uniref:Uncharacterized protein n=2 Tax=Trypanosoma cruzi TaxID=5693 RepID=Q4E5X4_TRYCC|nr:hypothetical protein Tc00.1047053508221.120 [Trypanosoma cruzi]EAO00137.1 hypothetical protein Tc00.1047053508221.120 [Trypanosoma cruzi]PWV21223.1 hypothetical protein C3747_3g207 [Trypanosoma cruzi]RNC39031.1 hypothetical protein TcCL_NonESM11667 [Trypanosoma cruzi]|eukprot:XP_821988.1 hypothetical protein [Trypanosoma cruzi strain CL Brener]
MRLDPPRCHLTPRTAALPVGPHRAAAGSPACSCRAECPATEHGHRQFPVPRLETSQSPTRILAATESSSAIEALRVAPLAVRDCVTKGIWIMLLFVVKRGHSVECVFSPSHGGVPCNEAAEKEAAVASSLPAMGCTNLARGLPCRSQAVMLERSPGGRGRRTHHTTGARRHSENSITCVRPNVAPRPAAPRTTAMRLLPTLR